VLLFPLEGSLNEARNDLSPMGNRDARYVFNASASWESVQDDEANVAWARAAWTDMRRYSTGGTYVNFLTEEEIGDRLHDAYGDHYDRLVQVKRAWDSDNLVRGNTNISPATAQRSRGRDAPARGPHTAPKVSAATGGAYPPATTRRR
jgi:hypothetical protein